MMHARCLQCMPLSAALAGWSHMLRQGVPGRQEGGWLSPAIDMLNCIAPFNVRPFPLCLCCKATPCPGGCAREGFIVASTVSASGGA